MKKIIMLLVCLFLITGCAVQKEAAPALTESMAVSTNTSQPAVSQTPADTSTPTATSLPTPTATLSYPLTNNTPMPPSTSPITVENVSNLRQLLLWSQNPPGQQVFSPDGSLLLYATTEWLRIYDVKNKTLISEIPEFIAPNGTLAISADNKRIMLIQSSIVKVIDLSGKEILAVPASGQASLSPDGHLLAVVDYCKYTGQILPECLTSVYDIETGEKITSYPGENPQFTPDSKNLIISQQNFLYFRRLSDGALIRQFDPDHYLNELGSWSLSPDGSIFVVIHGKKNPQIIDLVSINDGQLIKQYIEFVSIVYLSENNQYCAIISYDKVIINDITKDEVFYSGALPDKQYPSGVSNDGTLLFSIPASEVIDISESIRETKNLVWKEDAFHFDTFSNYRNEGQYCQIPQSGNAECSPEMNAFLASDGNYYQVEVDSEFITLQKVTGDILEMVTQINWKNQAFSNISGVSILAYSPMNNFLILQVNIGSNVSRVITVDLTKNLITNNWNWDVAQPDLVVMSPSSNFLGLKIVGRNYGQNAFLWDEGVFDFTKGWFVWHGGSNSTYLMRFSPDEKYLLEVQHRNHKISFVAVYDFIRREQVAFYEMQRDFSGEYGVCFVNDADISPDSSMVFFACEDGTLMVTELLTGKKIARWNAFNEPVTEVSISEDSTWLTAGASGLIKVWDVP